MEENIEISQQIIFENDKEKNSKTKEIKLINYSMDNGEDDNDKNNIKRKGKDQNRSKSKKKGYL